MPLFDKPLTQVLPLAVRSLGAINQRTVGGSGLVPSTAPPLALNLGATSSFLLHVCSFFFFLPVLYILVASNSILISAVLANAPLENISLGAESFRPNSLTTPIPGKHILYYKRVFCQKHSCKKLSVLVMSLVTIGHTIHF